MSALFENRCPNCDGERVEEGPDGEPIFCPRCGPDGPDPDREHDERDETRDEADARAWAEVPAGAEVK